MQDLAGCRLLFQRLAQGVREVLNFVLQVHVRQSQRTIRVRAADGRPALQTELCRRWVLRVAPGTLHSTASQRVGAGNGLTDGASLVWREGGVKESGTTHRVLRQLMLRQRRSELETVERMTIR